MSPWNIREFAGAICGFSEPNPYLAMLVAYFDESGIHDYSKVVSVAGLLGQTRAWSRLEKPWAKNLAVPRIKDLWFHAYECEEGVKQFDGISRPIRESLVAGLTNALLDRGLAFVGGSVFREDWENCAPPEFKQRFPDPYAFCIESAVQEACRFVDHNAPGERVALVIALPQHKLYREHVELVIDYLYHKSDLYPSLGSVTFGKPQELIPLQAADLFAFENYRYLAARWKHGKGNFPIRPNFKRMAESGLPFHANFHDCDTLKTLSLEWKAFDDEP
jgi:hypothetical protein